MALFVGEGAETGGGAIAFCCSSEMLLLTLFSPSAFSGETFRGGGPGGRRGGTDLARVLFSDSCDCGDLLGDLDRARRESSRRSLRESVAVFFCPDGNSNLRPTAGVLGAGFWMGVSGGRLGLADDDALRRRLLLVLFGMGGTPCEATTLLVTPGLGIRDGLLGAVGKISEVRASMIPRCGVGCEAALAVVARAVVVVLEPLPPFNMSALIFAVRFRAASLRSCNLLSSARLRAIASSTTFSETGGGA